MLTLAYLTKLNKKTHRWHDSRKFLDYRIKLAQKRGGFDDGYVDKKYMRFLSDQVFYCKWCGREMYAAEYNKGEIIMSCNKPMCPGNINCEVRHEISHLDYDQRQLTNQYMFNGRMQW